MNRCSRYDLCGSVGVSVGTRRSLPLDLRECVDPVRLMAWVNEAVLELEWSHPLVVEYVRRCPHDRPQMMLTLLAYVFLTRTCAAEAIVSACRTERDLQLLCEGTPPFATEVTGFRRKNRRLLQFVLERVILRVLLETREIGSTEVHGVAEEAKSQASERLDLARHMDSGD